MARHIQKVEAGEPHDGQRTRTAAPEEPWWAVRVLGSNGEKATKKGDIIGYNLWYNNGIIIMVIMVIMVYANDIPFWYKR